MNLKNLLFGIAIFILTLLVGIYGINTFYGASPDYINYCPSYLENESACVNSGGTWTPDLVNVEVKSVPVRSSGYCNYDYTSCQKNYDDAQKTYWKGTFLIALPLGIIVIVLGAIVFGLEFVGSGLMAGGVGILIYGAGNYWRFAQDWLRFTLSILGLVVLIWFAYWFNKRSGKKR